MIWIHTFPGGNFPIVYKGNIIFGAYTNQYKYYLAKSDGHSVTVINNPDSSQPNPDQPIIFNNKLFCAFVKNTFQLAQYDGDSIKFIKFPDGYAYNSNGGFTIYNGKLYMKCTHPVSPIDVIAAFDGNSIKILNSPFYVNDACPLIVYKNKLYYFTDSAGERLTSYDGENFKIIPNPFNVHDVYGTLIIYHNNLFFEGSIIEQGSFLMKYNGSKITILPKPDSGDIGNAGSYTDEWNPFIDSIHHQLCFLFTHYTPIANYI